MLPNTTKQHSLFLSVENANYASEMYFPESRVGRNLPIVLDLYSKKQMPDHHCETLDVCEAFFVGKPAARLVRMLLASRGLSSTHHYIWRGALDAEEGELQSDP